MHALGFTRSANRRDHIVQTPDTFVRAALPGMKDCTAVVHTGPASGACFTEYTAEMEAGGQLGPAHGQRFLYVLEGSLTVGESPQDSLNESGYAYFPPDDERVVVASVKARVVVIEKPYQRLDESAMPSPFCGSENAVGALPLMGDEDVQVRSLISGGIESDFAVNTMTFQPGASLAMVEMHVMEHGLLMLDGGGIYRLGEQWYP